MVAYYLKQDAFAFDVETVGDRREVPAVNEVLWISFATYGRGDVIPMGHPNGEFLAESFPLTATGEKRAAEGLPLRQSDYSVNKKLAIKSFDVAPTQLYPKEVFEAIKPLLFHDSILKIGHNLLFDLTSVAKYYDNQIPSDPYFDTLMASFLYNTGNKGKLGLDDCLQRELQFHMQKGIGHKVEDYSFNEVAKYSYLDARYTFFLWKKLKEKLISSNVLNVMELEMRVLSVLCDMKLTGQPIDTKQLEFLKAQFEVELEGIKSEIYKLAGVFNINSTVDRQRVLFAPKSDGGRGLKSKVKTSKGADSVSAEALEPFRDTDELANALLRYSDLNKLISTYVIPYLGGEVIKTVNGKTKIEIKDSLLVNGKIYADFVPWGAETGRFSSRNPNLQNIPAPEGDKVPTEKQYGRMIRNLFYAPEGYKLVVADYSQIEPRIIAAFSNDEKMVNNYLTGSDIYTTVGNELGVDRKAGKVLVLSMAYGVGPDKIAKQIGCTVQIARKLLTDFSDKFQDVSAYKAKVIGVARNLEYVTTILNRRRYLPDINSRDIALKASSERQAFNTKIQGSAADIIKYAMIRAYDRLPQESKLILTVHDELVTICPDNLVEETKQAIKEAMEGIDITKLSTRKGIAPIPLLADMKVVQRWGEAK